MSDLPGSRLSLATLFLCLCLGSLVVLPILNGAGPIAMEIFEFDTENENFSGQVEADDDLIVTSIGRLNIAGSIFSKSKTANLNFHSFCPTAVFPPPKQA